MENIIDKISKDLEVNADAKTKASTERFFKEEIISHGVSSKLVGKVAKENYQLVKGKSKAEIFDLCEKLWLTGFIEETFIAGNWSYNLHKSFEPKDFEVFERWIKKYINNWASCDSFCNHTVGEFIEMHPEYLSKLKEFAKSENRWVRRAAAVSLIVPAKKGKFLKDVLEIADIMLLDNEDMVQKGYGWMLKVASQAHQKEIFDYVVSKKTVMPRTALRYAIEKMPAELKAIAMKK